MTTTTTPKAEWLRALGIRIAGARALRNLSQADLASAVGVHVQTVYRWEAGTQPPDSYSLWLCCRVLRVRVGKIIC